MAHKTKEELFGDGGGFGAAVPYSITPPSGHGSGNRGIAFGEPLTASISNRPHYAIAENTDELDLRITSFEAGGLDAAYDQGTVGPAGGGREITKDAGAVETTSTTATIYADDLSNAHFRANASGDVAAGATGFDFVGKTSAAAGLIDRRVLVMATSYTDITASMNATLNPGGAGSTLCRLIDPSRKFHTSGTTDLALTLDLLEVMTGTNVGLYVINTLGGSNTDVTLARIDRASPTFGSNTAATVRVLRVQFRSGSQDAFFVGPAVIVGLPAAYSALALSSGSPSDTDVSNGATNISTHYLRSATGNAQRVGRIDAIGRRISELGPGHVSDTAQHHRNGGWAGFIKDYSTGTYGGTDHGGGFLAWAGTSGATDPAVRLDYMSLLSYSETGHIGPTFSVTLGATSPTGGVVTLTAPIADWEDNFPPFSFVYITSGAETGLYYVVDTDPGPDTLTLRSLNGTVPAHFGTSGTRTLALYTPQIMGARLANLPLYTSALRERTVGSQTFTPYNLMVAGGEDDAAALVLTAGRNVDETLEMRALIRGIQANSTGAHQETFLVEPKGKVFARTGFTTAANGVVSADNFTYVTTATRNIQIPVALATPSLVSTSPLDQGWAFSAAVSLPRWRSMLDSGVLLVPLSAFLRTGQLITAFDVLGTRGTGHSVQPAIHLIKRVTNWGTPAIATETTITPASTTAFSAGSPTKYTKTFNSGNTVDLSTEDWYLQIIAGDTGAANPDYIHAFRISVTDIGPRNY